MTSNLASSPPPLRLCCWPLPCRGSRADEFSTSQRSEVERIVREYLIAHPDVLQDAMAELEKRQTAAEAEKHKAAVKEQYAERCSPRRVRSCSAIRTAMSPSSSSSITTAATASAPWMTCSRCLRTTPSSGSCSRNSRCSGPARWKPRRSRLPCACRTRAARNTSNSTRSCSAAAARPTRRARSRSPRTSVSTWRRLDKDMASPEVKATIAGELQARRGARAQRHAELRDRRRRRGRRSRTRCAQRKGQYLALRQAELLTDIRPQPFCTNHRPPQRLTAAAFCVDRHGTKFRRAVVARMYTLGMEEEYFLFDARRATRCAARTRNSFRSHKRQLGDHVMTEMLQSQLEVATPPCTSMREARGHLPIIVVRWPGGCRPQARARRHGHVSARLLAGTDRDARRRDTAPSWMICR